MDGQELTTNIFNHSLTFVKKAFDGRTTSAREVLTQVRASRFSKVNPNLKIVPDIVSTIDPPLIDFQFVDGSQVRDIFFFFYLITDYEINVKVSMSHVSQKSFDSQGYHAKEILDEVYQYLTNLDMEYQLADKNIDDLQ